jgi:hypothetical protein
MSVVVVVFVVLVVLILLLCGHHCAGVVDGFADDISYFVTLFNM